MAKRKSSFNEDGVVEINIPEILHLWEKPAPENKQMIAAENKPSDSTDLTPKKGKPNGKNSNNSRTS